MSQPKPKVGAPIKPRLSNEWRRTLTNSEQVLARSIIRQLRRLDQRKQPRRASGAVKLPSGAYEILVSSGKLRLNGKWTGRADRDATVSDVICRAVKEGLFRRNSGDGDDFRDSFEDEFGNEFENEREDEREDTDYDRDEDEDYAEGEEEISASASSNGGGSSSPDDEWEKLKRRLAEIREYLDSEEAEHSDRVSNRPYLDGARMIAKGIPADGVLHAWAINWPESAREACGIEPWDPAEFRRDDVPKDRHKLYPYIRTLIEAGVPVYLKGPSQAGKSFVLAQVARDLSMPFRQIPLTAGASTSWLLGTWTPQGWVEAGFPAIYTGGGVFLFDEIDAGDPNMLIVVNNAVSNDTLDNPRNGEVLRKSPLFRPVAAGNTWGTGATSQYTGRARMDGATLERFRCGRVEVDYDPDMQERIGDAAFAAAMNGEVA